ncbi:BTB/POZ domain-containing protein At1g03010-like [Impatiens glandulifera]|uniref:BTB/POZ domain-containing protein At1g03010-like n=1 Tax=Impatiens glandulifera TaxID=253017 RepID=UPI001FB0D128|nr:BTB/POZ domain-containing protein At1g03010-like [Impatiens glandulifera]
MQWTPDLAYEEVPTELISKQIRRLRNKEISMVKVLWSNHFTSEATWEVEEEMQKRYPTLAELIPDHARVMGDGLYRDVYIFFKVHPNIKDSERYKLCKTVYNQKLSQDTCNHAAQNERLRNAMNGSNSPNQFFFGSTNGKFPQRSGSVGSGTGSGFISPKDSYACVRRENRELKLEVARMRMRLIDLEKDHVSMKQELCLDHEEEMPQISMSKKGKSV